MGLGGAGLAGCVGAAGARYAYAGVAAAPNVSRAKAVAPTTPRYFTRRAEFAPIFISNFEVTLNWLTN